MTESNDFDDSVVASQSLSKPAESTGIAKDLVNLLRGFCMGVADTVPGVSGGTVALILGHYDRLIAAISQINREAIGLLARGQFSRLLSHLDFRFLAALGMGIVTGIVTLAGVMHWCLQHRLNETMAVFFGLILASAWVVRRFVGDWTPKRWLCLIAGVFIALAVSQIPSGGGSVSLGYLFISAAISICAMILPGISGAFIMLLLGVYEPVIGMIKQFASGDLTLMLLTKLTVFACGCLFGLLAFSRLLNYLLRHFHDATMATLIGLMIGSIGRLWPLQQVTPETADRKLKYQEFVWVTPSEYPGSLTVLVLLAVGAGAIVLVANQFAKQNRESI